jgi:hypothetical protein
MCSTCGKPILMDGLCVRHVKQSCSVCLEPVSSTNTINSKRLACGHAFHVPCIMEWFVESDECPQCRSKQPSDPILQFREKSQNVIRARFRDALVSLEEENSRLKETLRLQSMFVNARLEREEVIPPAPGGTADTIIGMLHGTHAPMNEGERTIVQFMMAMQEETDSDEDSVTS